MLQPTLQKRSKVALFWGSCWDLLLEEKGFKKKLYFSYFLVSSIKGASKTRRTNNEIVLTPTTKEPKISYALAATSPFNLKLCHNVNVALYFGLGNGSYLWSQIPMYVGFRYWDKTFLVTHPLAIQIFSLASYTELQNKIAPYSFRLLYIERS